MQLEGAHDRSLSEESGKVRVLRDQMSGTLNPGKKGAGTNNTEHAVGHRLLVPASISQSSSKHLRLERNAGYLLLQFSGNADSAGIDT